MRTRVTAALVAPLAVLAWVTSVATVPPSALAASTLAPPHRRRPASAATAHLSRISDTAAIVGVVVFLLALVILVSQWRRHHGRSRVSARPADTAARGEAADDLATDDLATDDLATDDLATDDLATMAARALVQTDDAVRTSEQEVGFATARFGERAAAPFLAALRSARALLSSSFDLRQQLDDDIGADEVTLRSCLTDILERCAAANRLLDAQAEAFDGLQDLEARSPQVVAEVDAHVVQQSARVDRYRELLDQMAAKYTGAAVESVNSSPDVAAGRLEFAANCLASASRLLADGRPDDAALLLQAAESGADQATDLLSGIEHREAQLTQAASALPGALREIEIEIAAAAAVVAGLPQDERMWPLAAAQAIVASIRARQAAGPFDSLAALRELEQADAGLDRALTSVRSEQDRRQRARPVLDYAMLVARSSVTAAEESVETRRGAVGVQARTRLAEAHRRFGAAIDRAQADPEAALGSAHEADVLAQEARVQAEDDVARFDPAEDGRLALAEAAIGGPGAGLSGAILGGIVVAGPLGAGQGIGPGSFGGVSTRRRHLICQTNGATEPARIREVHSLGDARGTSEIRSIDDVRRTSGQHSLTDRL